MKRLFTIILTICLLIPQLFCLAENENFKFKNDIHFGDTINEVKQKDELMIDSKISTNFPPASKTVIYPEYVSSKSAQLAGRPCSLHYFFTKNSLEEIYYTFTPDNGNTPTILEETYEVIQMALIQKYGEPLEKNSQLRNDIMGPAAQNYGVITDSLEGRYRTYLKVNHDAWLIQYDGYYIKIDLGFLVMDQKNAWVAIDYYQLSNEEYDDLVNRDMSPQPAAIPESNNSDLSDLI